ncbi:hypothetical protein UFOVP329_70 [uncultured Caudovirales phage]|uniref:Uncharacterized protein n=1 Tax=uncultured Caudovirales phage TaxID=2100421 RepID=A0A6J5LV32_9CAUD|nr:hypothetical protein UFOVP329_70 [uncultured Caudovirales phage]
MQSAIFRGHRCCEHCAASAARGIADVSKSFFALCNPIDARHGHRRHKSRNAIRREELPAMRVRHFHAHVKPAKVIGETISVEATRKQREAFAKLVYAIAIVLLDDAKILVFARLANVGRARPSVRYCDSRHRNEVAEQLPRRSTARTGNAVNGICDRSPVLLLRSVLLRVSSSHAPIYEIGSGEVSRSISSRNQLRPLIPIRSKNSDRRESLDRSRPVTLLVTISASG